ncbi:MAG: methionyl-tRNA formyltransferase [Nitrospirae bacterium]|nr:methionyl-tRNA formyltransferase [Nitrospirota bacterium]
MTHDGPPLRVVFAGSSTFSVPVLEALLKGPDSVAAVVTTPDRPRGRGLHPEPSAVKSAAERYGIAVFTPERLSDPAFLEALSTLSPAVGVVVAYGKIIPSPALTLPALGWVNIHASLLPLYRGAAPIQWALINGERETGVTLFLLDREVDHGPVLAKTRVPIRPGETAATLHDRLAEVGAELLSETLPRWADGKIRPRPQDHARATYAPKITKEDGRIAWKDPADVIERKIRALHPWPGAYARLDSLNLRILAGTTRADSTGAAPPGSITRTDPHGIEVACGEGRLVITRVQPESRRPMSAGDFLHGHAIAPGTFFA